MTTVVDNLTESSGVKGQAHRHDDDTLLLLALLLIDDVEEAAIYWRRLAPQQYKGLIDAALADPRFPKVPEARATSSIPAFDPTQLLYVRKLGDVITAEEVRRATLTVISKAQAELQRDTLAMLFGAIELGEWQDRMQSAIKRLHIAAASLGMGGTGRISADQLARSAERMPKNMSQVETLGDLITFQFGRLNEFAIQIEDRAQQASTDHKIETRISLYGASAYPTYERGRRIAADVAGFTLERNILSSAEHCLAGPDEAVEDCPSQTEKGWSPLGSLVPIGMRKCAMNCRCSTEFKRGEES